MHQAHENQHVASNTDETSRVSDCSGTLACPVAGHVGLGEAPRQGPQTLREHLADVVAESLVAAQFDTRQDRAATVVTAVLAELCPKGSILARLDATVLHEEGLDTPSSWEPAYDYAIVTGTTILEDRLDDRTAGLLCASAEIGEALDDAATGLEHQLVRRFSAQLEDVRTEKGVPDAWPALR